MEEIAKFESRRYKFPATFIDERYSRENIYSEICSHAVGYVGSIGDDYLEEILIDQNLSLKETILTHYAHIWVGLVGGEASTNA